MEEFHYIDVSFYASIKHIGAKIIVKVEAGENDSLRSLVENAIREKLQLQLWQASLHLFPVGCCLHWCNHCIAAKARVSL